ncbi:MAG: AAA family ATPase [Christensenellaceae bacterium]|jgi:exodeoxyribonuclease V alpha subunit|nr:AAA family ATPase [Christensenellaceae bacterium]
MEIVGVVSNITFRNEDSGYSVVRLSNGIIAVGTMPFVAVGGEYKFFGRYVTHAKHGEQFEIAKYELLPPDNDSKIIAFIGGGLIYGVGPVTAKRIVKKFGKGTLDIMANSPEKLSAVHGISPTKAQKIGEEYKQIQSLQEVVMYFAKFEISLNMAIRIYKHYGDTAVAVASRNPYTLIEAIDGIGFLTADKMAKTLGVAHNSNFRVRAGIIYCLGQSAETDGNTYLPLPVLSKSVCRLLQINMEELVPLFNGIINELCLDRILVPVDIDGISGVMLAKFFNAEKIIAQKVNLLMGDTNTYTGGEIDDLLAHYEELNRIKLHEKQKDAVKTAINSGFCVITGGPGTGKTTIIKAILYITRANNLTTQLLAPTGRAAKRICETTGAEAMTIHRCLDIDYKGGGGKSFTYDNPDNYIKTDLVVVDEVSMCDAVLSSQLLRKIMVGTRVVFVGDIDQLPSVGAGNVLADIIKSGVVPVVRLTEIYRQNEKSTIAINAHRINCGQIPLLDNKSTDFFYEFADTPAEIRDKVLALATTRLPKYLAQMGGPGATPGGTENNDTAQGNNIGNNAITQGNKVVGNRTIQSGGTANNITNNIQILSPMKLGDAGMNNLNLVLQSALNPESNTKPQYAYGDTIFRVGDRVMHTVNNYKQEWQRGGEHGKGVFNGDIGTILTINKDDGEIVVELEDGRTTTYLRPDLAALTLSYAITVHKSQGCEFDAVIVPVVNGAYMIMTRNLLYTAVTRAKRLVVLVGRTDNIQKMVENTYTKKRHSALAKFLQQFVNTASDY